MIRVGIAEDDLKYIQIINGYINKYSTLHSVDMHITTFNDGEELVFNYEPMYDILLLDIEMPKKDGMKAAKEIRKIDEKVLIIFITNMAQYAMNGYEVDALDYVLKPISYYSFEMKFSKAISRLPNKNEMNIIVPYKGGYKKISVKDITYVEVKDHWLYFYTEQEQFQMLGTMKEIRSKLEEYYFCNCNNCFLVNLNFVTFLGTEQIEVANKYILKMSRSRKKEFKLALMKYYGGTGK